MRIKIKAKSDRKIPRKEESLSTLFLSNGKSNLM